MYADAHCDTLTKVFDENRSLYENNFQLDIKRLKEQNCILQFMAIWIEPKFELYSAFDRVCNIIEMYQENSFDGVNTVLNGTEIDPFKLNILLSVEGGGAIEGKIENLHRLYDMGIRAMTLTWNGDNQLCGGIGNNSSGLTALGKDVVKEMNKLGMIVDVSHISDRGFWDVSEICDTFIASHSNCRTLCKNPRNLTDSQIKCIAERNGFIGLNFYSDFLNENGASTDDILRHADHIINLGGENVLGFGSDFDGMKNLPYGICGVENMVNITKHFCKNNILYGNLCRNVHNILKK